MYLVTSRIMYMTSTPQLITRNVLVGDKYLATGDNSATIINI